MSIKTYNNDFVKVIRKKSPKKGVDITDTRNGRIYKVEGTRLSEIDSQINLDSVTIHKGCNCRFLPSFSCRDFWFIYRGKQCYVTRDISLIRANKIVQCSFSRINSVPEGFIQKIKRPKDSSGRVSYGKRKYITIEWQRLEDLEEGHSKEVVLHNRCCNATKRLRNQAVIKPYKHNKDFETRGFQVSFQLNSKDIVSYLKKVNEMGGEVHPCFNLNGTRQSNGNLVTLIPNTYVETFNKLVKGVFSFVTSKNHSRDILEPFFFRLNKSFEENTDPIIRDKGINIKPNYAIAPSFAVLEGLDKHTKDNYSILVGLESPDPKKGYNDWNMSIPGGKSNVIIEKGTFRAETGLETCRREFREEVSLGFEDQLFNDGLQLAKDHNLQMLHEGKAKLRLGMQYHFMIVPEGRDIEHRLVNEENEDSYIQLFYKKN